MIAARPPYVSGATPCPTARPGLSSPAPRLSVVIPAVNEADALPRLLDDLAGLAGDDVEVLVVDGGSRDATARVAVERGARVLTGARGRGPQLRAGAAAARAPLLCFLHADARLDRDALAVLAGLARAPRGPARAAAWAFRLRIDAPGFSYRLIEWGANQRAARFGLPYGDQGLVVTRAAYDAAGGYPAVPLMEDVALVRALGRALGRRGRVRLLAASVRVSARRWAHDGVWRRSAGNLLLLARYLAGTPPERLAAAYERRRPPAPPSA